MTSLLYILGMRAFSSRSYAVAIFSWVAVYAVLLFGSISLLKTGTIQWLPLKALIALSPMIAGFGIVVSITRSYRRMDELEQKIIAESIMFAFGATAILTFSYGFLQGNLGAPDLSYFWVWPVLASTWIIGGVLARRHYK